MALTYADKSIWEELAAKQLIPPSPNVLEIGEGNWYGDVAPDDADASPDPFVTARNFYNRVLKPAKMVAIDFTGTICALRLDLNNPITLPDNLPQRFEVIINTGTAEHVFDQRQLFQTIHERCLPGGLMLHAAPWKGWHDHGFHNYQPTFFKHLALANEYETLLTRTWQPWNQSDLMLYTVFCKVGDERFLAPIQGMRKV